MFTEVTTIRHLLIDLLLVARGAHTDAIEEQQTRPSDPDVTGKERRRAGSLVRQGRKAIARVDRKLAALTR